MIGAVEGMGVGIVASPAGEGAHAGLECRQAHVLGLLVATVRGHIGPKLRETVQDGLIDAVRVFREKRCPARGDAIVIVPGDRQSAGADQKAGSLLQTCPQLVRRRRRRRVRQLAPQQRERLGIDAAGKARRLERLTDGVADTNSLAGWSLFNKNGAAIGTYTFQGPLEAGKTYTRREQVTIPLHTSERYEILVRTDSQNTVYEHTREDNNQSADDTQISVSVLPRPDLQVFSVTGPDVVDAGGTASIGVWAHSVAGLSARAASAAGSTCQTSSQISTPTRTPSTSTTSGAAPGVK